MRALCDHVTIAGPSAESGAPLAPFWSAFAFRQLIDGARVLSTTVEGADAASLKAYAFQQIKGAAGGDGGGRRQRWRQGQQLRYDALPAVVGIGP